jgi:hypothetical protein
MCQITDSLIAWIRRIVRPPSANRPAATPASRPPSPRGKETAMSIWSRLFNRTSTRQVSNWAVEVARQCQLEVAERLSGSIHRMSLPEARGYIRARAGRVIDAEISLVSRRTGCQPAVAVAIRERAMEETIRLAIGELLRATRRTVVSEPAVVRPLRRAA